MAYRTGTVSYDYDADGTVISSTLIVCTTRTGDGFYGTETYDRSNALIEVCSKPRGRPIACADV